jgi:hypothetical protein
MSLGLETLCALLYTESVVALYIHYCEYEET